MQAFKNIYRTLTPQIMTLECGGSIIIFDTDDYPAISAKQWSVGTHGYVTSGAGKDQVLMHRYVMNLADNELEVDHINRNKMDNRKCNLRICTTEENTWNHPAQSNSKTGLKGVCKTADGCYQAQIVVNGKAIYLGKYKTSEEASKAYDSVHNFVAGEYSCPNIDKTIDPGILERIMQIKRRRRLSAADRASIIQLSTKGTSISAISKIIGCANSTVRRFLSGKTYGGKYHA